MTTSLDTSRLARTLVASAQRGQIVLGPARRHVGENRVACQVIDHDGEPVLAIACPDTARQMADRLVRVELAGESGERACLLGRLHRADPERVVAQAGRWEAGVLRASLREGATLLRLSVHDVSVEQSRRLRRVALEDYAAADPDVIAAHGPRILAHLNHAHPGPLRQVAALTLGCAPDRLVGAHLDRVDADGVELWAIDEDGARPLRLNFPSRVSDMDGLVGALRAALKPPA